ncbi:MAG: FG-GAP repeat domain-containing protein [Gemmataceae bacterium]
MRRYTWMMAPVVPFVLVFALLPAADEKTSDNFGITWKKTVIDRRFLSEGVAVADVNKDGKMDILTGELWYEAPDWYPHRIRPGKEDYRDGDKNVYSNSFACWADDLNGDGWPDLIVVGFPGAPCHWYENPKGKAGNWNEHTIWHSACNETPAYVDLLGTGKRVLLMGWQPKGKENEGQMAYFTPSDDPTQLWRMHPVSEPSTKGHVIPGTFRFSHGLGAGDVNGDGKLDVLCTDGWWEQPAKLDDKPWKFHPAKLGDACADMFAYDIDGDGKADVISSSAHQYGIWAYLQRPGSESAAFVKHDLFPRLFSQTHALHCVDINGDGIKDLVTGKRWWAHGPHGDADPNGRAKLFWFEAKKNQDGLIRFVPHQIDDDSGIGTQFTVADVNGDKLLDVVTANKKGVFLFEQARQRP